MAPAPDPDPLKTPAPAIGTVGPPMRALSLGDAGASRGKRRRGFSGPGEPLGDSGLNTGPFPIT